MSYVRSCVNLVFDNAHRLGYPKLLGCGRDWPAIPDEETERLAGRSPDVDTPIGWDLGGQCEYIDAVQGIGPVGVAELRDLATGAGRSTILSGITVSPSSYWRPSPTGGCFGGVRWLQYHDGRAGRLATDDFGQAVFADQDYRNVHLWLYRRPIAADETGAVAIDLVWHGPEGYTGPVYGIHLPRAKRETKQSALREVEQRRYRHPVLMGRGIDCEEWSVISESERVRAGLRDEADVRVAFYDEIRIESIGKTLVVRWFSRDEAWSFSGDWHDALGRRVHFAGLPAGRLEVMIYGETVDLCVAPILYERDVTIRPSGWFYTNMRMQQTPWYRRLALGPAEAIVNIEAEFDGSGRRSRPVVTFDGPEADDDETRSPVRGVLQRVQEFRWPVLTGASSEPVQTQGNSNLIIRNVSGRCDATWRGSSMEATLVADHAGTLPTIRGNQWLRAEVSCDDGATYHTQFHGRVVPPEDIQQGADPRELRVRAVGDDERLRQHKGMYAHPSYEWWPAERAWNYILARQNVVPAQRFVDVEILANPDKFVLPRAEDGDGRLAFDEQQSPIDALDAICTACNLEWGWDGPHDRYFLRVRRPYVRGFYNLEIDQATMSADDGNLIYDLSRLQTVEEYANIIHVLAERGVDAVAATLVNWASIGDPDDATFIADDWLHMEHYEDAQAVGTLAARLYERRGRLGELAIAVLCDLPEITPEYALKITAPVVNVAAGTIYMVDAKAWRDVDGEYEQTLELVRVQEGTA